MNHYLMLVFEGKSEVKREYLALTDVDESKEHAIERWIARHPRMQGRQRNIEKTRNALRESISWSRICRPSSWARAQREASTTKAAPMRRSR